MQFIKTHKHMKAYHSEWLNNINEEIQKVHPNRTIENYPDIKLAFKKMKKAWKACFDDPKNIKKIFKRDKAISEIGRSIAVSLQRKKKT
jgi:hypothetical protein